jgi:hypothetical protein
MNTPQTGDFVIKMFEIFFLMFFGFLIFIIIFSSIKESQFSQKVSLSLQNKFPNLETVILSEGGFFSNPHIRGVAKYKKEAVRYIEVKVKVYHSGKHRHEDLILTAHVLKPEIPNKDFSVVIKKEGFFKRIFGGENVQLGNKSLDETLYIKASDPYKAKSLLIENKYLISTSIAQIFDLKECKINVRNEDIELFIRSDKVSARYVDSLFNLVQSISNDRSFESRLGRLSPQNVIGSISERISYPIVKSKRFQSRKSSYDTHYKELPKNSHFNEIKEKLKDYTSFIGDPKIEDTSASITTSGFFKEIEFNWTEKEINLQSQRLSNLSTSFRILMCKTAKASQQYDWNDSFAGIDIEIKPNDISEDFLSRYEIGRYFNEITGDFPPQLKVEYDKDVCQVSIFASSLPENIKPMIDLIQALGWFIELSFITYF